MLAVWMATKEIGCTGTSNLSTSKFAFGTFRSLSSASATNRLAEVAPDGGYFEQSVVMDGINGGVMTKLQFLPDGRGLIAQKTGKILIFDPRQFPSEKPVVYMYRSNRLLSFAPPT